jgi:hypothetical protein
VNHNQDVETPSIFVQAVEAYLGIHFQYDMAATADNRKAPEFFTKDQDSLSLAWPKDGWCWLNPPFCNAGEWALKCAEQQDRGCRIVSIWPLSGDLNQIVTWTHARVIVVHGRVWPVVRGVMLGIWRQNHIDYPRVSGVRWDKKTLTKVW